MMFCSVFHCRYQHSWMWSDDTLAIFLSIIGSSSGVAAPYCAMMEAGNANHTLSAVACDQKLKGSFLCELHAGPTSDDALTPVQFPALSSWSLSPRMASCDHNHITHSFLACDPKANCSAVDLASSISCSEGRFSPAVPFFTCRNGVERVPFSLVCDHRADCCDSSDEDFCQFPACLRRKQFYCKNKKQVRLFGCMFSVSDIYIYIMLDQG